MQADDEVGKVAQQTPIAVGKALELFMVALVSKSAEVARERSSKRVSAQMLKHVVESDDQWDFLREIVSKVPDEEKPGRAAAATTPGGGREVKGESESDEEVEVPEKKKRAGRKKKT
jgi:Dr1-associated corepressor